MCYEGSRIWGLPYGLHLMAVNGVSWKKSKNRFYLHNCLIGVFFARLSYYQSGKNNLSIRTYSSTTGRVLLYVTI